MIIRRTIPQESEIHIILVALFKNTNLHITKLLMAFSTFWKGPVQVPHPEIKLQQLQSRFASENNNYHLLCQSVPEAFHMYLSYYTSKEGLSSFLQMWKLWIKGLLPTPGHTGGIGIRSSSDWFLNPDSFQHTSRSQHLQRLCTCRGLVLH